MTLAKSNPRRTVSKAHEPEALRDIDLRLCIERMINEGCPNAQPAIRPAHSNPVNRGATEGGGASTRDRRKA